MPRRTRGPSADLLTGSRGPELLTLALDTGLSHTLTGRANQLTTYEQGPRPQLCIPASPGLVLHRWAQGHMTRCCFSPQPQWGHKATWCPRPPLLGAVSARGPGTASWLCPRLSWEPRPVRVVLPTSPTHLHGPRRTPSSPRSDPTLPAPRGPCLWAWPGFQPESPEAAQAASSSLADGAGAVAAFTPSPFFPKPDGKRIYSGPVAGHSWARAGTEEEDPGVTGLQQRAGGLLGKKGERCS